MARQKEITYWEKRARRVEAMLKHEAHINTYMIKWLRIKYPAIHKEMADFYTQQNANEIDFEYDLAKKLMVIVR